MSWSTQIGYARPLSEIPSLTHRAPALLLQLHGLPGSGKTHVLNHLRASLPSKYYVFFETSDIISKLCSGMDKFLQATPADKAKGRKDALREMHRECVVAGKVGVIAGFALQEDEWTGEGGCQEVDMPVDTGVVTHVLFLQVPVGVLEQRRMLDCAKGRKALHADGQVNKMLLQEWQDVERERVQKICGDEGVEFEVRTFGEGEGEMEEIVKLVGGLEKKLLDSR